MKPVYDYDEELLPVMERLHELFSHTNHYQNYARSLRKLFVHITLHIIESDRGKGFLVDELWDLVELYEAIHPLEQVDD